MAQSSNNSAPGATTERLRFPITQWPQEPLPVPEVDVSDVDVIDGAHGVWFHLRPTARTVGLPVDYYLREPRAVDVNDLAQVAAFVQTWGRCSDDEYRDLPVPLAWSRSVERSAQVRGWLPAQLWKCRTEVANDLGLAPLQRIVHLVHPAEVLLRIEKLRRMADHVEQWQRGGDIDAPWPGGDRPGSVLLRDYLNAGLSAYQVRIDVLGEPPSVASQPVTAYSAACLQLWNDLHGATWRTCVACGRLFTRQRGRARHFNRTEGLSFCERACANVQTQREYRRRQRAKREQQA